MKASFYYLVLIFLIIAAPASRAQLPDASPTPSPGLG